MTATAAQPMHWRCLHEGCPEHGGPFQPTTTGRGPDQRHVAASGHTVVCSWREWP